jgi:hypothetical protein
MCEVAIKGGLPLGRTVSQGEDPRTSFWLRGSQFHDEYHAQLPPAVMDWFGVDSDDPELIVPRQVMEVAEAVFSGAWREDKMLRASTLNDDAGMTFAMIADCFEYTFLREDWDAAHA